MLSHIAYYLDPETYGLDRAPVVLGILAAGTALTIGAKLLEILRNLGLPS